MHQHSASPVATQFEIASRQDTTTYRRQSLHSIRPDTWLRECTYPTSFRRPCQAEERWVVCACACCACRRAELSKTEQRYWYLKYATEGAGKIHQTNGIMSHATLAAIQDVAHSRRRRNSTEHARQHDVFIRRIGWRRQRTPLSWCQSRCSRSRSTGCSFMS